MKHKTTLIIPLILITIIISILIYNNETKEQVLDTTINTSQVAIYIQNDDNSYTSTNTFPTTGYVLNETNSYCEVDGVTDTNTTIAYTPGTATISINSTNTLCYIYLDIE